MSLPWTQTGLRFVAVQNLICLEEVKLSMALLKHIDTRQSPSRSHESLLHTGGIDGIPTMQHSTMVKQSEQNQLIIITKNILDQTYVDISIFRERSYNSCS